MSKVLKQIEWVDSTNKYDFHIIIGNVGGMRFVIHQNDVDNYTMQVNTSDQTWRDQNLTVLKEFAITYAKEFSFGMLEEFDQSEMLRKSLEATNRLLNSKEGQDIIDKMIQEREEDDKRILECKLKYDAMTDESFKELIITEEKKYDDAFQTACYKKGYEPYPEGEICDVITVMLEHGVDRKMSPDEWGDFESVHRLYKGLEIVRFDGQGSFFRIFDDKTQLFQT
jgi:hypothetical protein